MAYSQKRPAEAKKTACSRRTPDQERCESSCDGKAGVYG